jgi:hypothetical protein
METQSKETGFSNLELLILLFFVVGGVYLIISSPVGHFPGFDSPTGGLVARSIQESGEAIRVTGTPTGYPATWQEIDGIAAIPAAEDQHAIGFVRVSITPLIGTFAIDTNLMQISFVMNGSPIPLRKTRGNHVETGRWVIVGKYNVLPGKSADRDDILEANEVFDILLSLPEPLGPHRKASIVFLPDHGMPYILKISIPPVIRPVTMLS